MIDELWNFQKTGRDFLLRNRRVILGDEMGLGKTRIALAALEQVYDEDPVLVVCGKNAMLAWKNETAEQTPHIPVTLVRGTLYAREQCWKRASEGHGGLYLVTPQAFMRDCRVIMPKWKFVIIDEYHKFMIHRSGTFKILKKIQSDYLFQISGSPMKTGAHNLWPALSVARPREFTSFWRFVDNFCHVNDTGFGKNISGIKNEQDLFESISSIFIGRKKKDVKKDMPPKIRRRLPVVMEDSQAQVYNSLRKEMIALLKSGEILIAQNALTKSIMLRKLLIMPKTLDESLGYGAGMEEVISRMGDSDTHCAIYTPFLAPIPYIKERIEKEGWGPVIVLQGGLELEELEERINLFRSERGIAIVSIRFAQSFELVPAEYGYFLGYERNAEDNKQAEDRLHRGNITKGVNIYYVENENTIDAKALKILNSRERDTNLLFNTAAQWLELLDH